MARCPTRGQGNFPSVFSGRNWANAWDRVGGLDIRYPFSYEDADFVRRARALGVQVSGMRTNVVHLHSQTAGSSLRPCSRSLRGQRSST